MDKVRLERFVAESNRIEGMFGVLDQEIKAHEELLEAKFPTISDMVQFVSLVQPGAVLRDRVGLNVRVGSYIAPPGGERIVHRLDGLMYEARGQMNPWHVHVAYENLHPFTDGNGRSGRALWLWMMRNQNNKLAELGFLHAFYYQTLENNSGR